MGAVIEMTGSLRRYAYGIVHYSIDLICAAPSQHLRRWALTGIFGLRLGPECVLYRRCRMRAPWKISIGRGTAIGSGTELDGRGRIRIGNNVNLSSEVMLWTMQHDYRDPDFSVKTAGIEIGDYAWLGPRVIVLPGVRIGEGSVVGAGAVVTGNTDPYAVYAGVPAQRIGERPRGARYVPGRNATPVI